MAIGDKWYFVESSPVRCNDPSPKLSIGSAVVIGETPRKWILRESEQCERDATSAHVSAPGEGWLDWQIFKKGDDAREGRGPRGSIRMFYATEECANTALANALEARWADANAYKIADMISRRGMSPAVLRQIAALVGYKETP